MSAAKWVTTRRSILKRGDFTLIVEEDDFDQKYRFDWTLLYRDIANDGGISTTMRGAKAAAERAARRLARGAK